jgi:hypothetical protein
MSAQVPRRIQVTSNHSSTAHAYRRINHQSSTLSHCACTVTKAQSSVHLALQSPTFASESRSKYWLSRFSFSRIVFILNPFQFIRHFDFITQFACHITTHCRYQNSSFIVSDVCHPVFTRPFQRHLLPFNNRPSLRPVSKNAGHSTLENYAIRMLGTRVFHNCRVSPPNQVRPLPTMQQVLSL